VIWLVRAAFVSALGLELLVLHFPAPSGVGPSAEEDVRGAWHLAGRVARAGVEVAREVVPEVVRNAVAPLVSDKTLHFLLFLPLGVLAALERRLHGPLSGGTVLRLLLGLAVYAALGEASQVLGGRIVDLGDFVANVAGGIAGVLMIALPGAPAPTPSAAR